MQSKKSKLKKWRSMSDNRSQVFAALNAWERRMDKAAQMATKQISNEVERNARKIVGEIVHPRGTPHVPTASGGPNTVTGNLGRNILAALPRREGFGTYVAIVGANTIYARQLEEGGGNWPAGVKYPFMRPARNEVVESGKARIILTGYVRAAMGG